MKELYNKSKIGFLWTFSGNVAKALFGFGTLIALTYFLPPAELGLISILMVVYGLSETLAQFGLSESIIGRAKVDSKELSTIFWMNIVIGALVCAGVYFIAPFLASFYGHTDLTNLIRLMGVMFLVEPWGLVFKAILEKELRFSISEKIFMVRHAVQAIIIVSLLLLGYGVNGFVWGTLAGSFIAVPLFVGVFRKQKWWMPEFHFSFMDVRVHYSFGVFVTGKEFANFLGRNLDELIVGKMFGLEALGIYFFAKKIIERPTQAFSSPFSRVTFPFFAALKEDMSRLTKTYLSLTGLVSSLGFVAMGIALIIASFMIHLVFGPLWDGSHVLVRIFILASVFQILLVGFGTPILYALNRPKLVFVIELAMTIAKCIAFFLASFVSVELVATVLLGATVLKLVIIQTYANRELGFGWYAYLREIRTAFVSLVCALGVAMSPILITGHEYEVITSLLFITTYAFLILSFDRRLLTRISRLFV